MKLSKIIGTLSLSLALATVTAQAQQIDITLTNSTNGIYYTPFVVSAHGQDFHIFQVGEAASAELQAQAEGGSTDGVVGLLDAVSAVTITDPAAGLLAPGASTTTSMDTGSNSYLSITAMMLPTNDGFVGLDGWKIPDTAGTYYLNLNAYDAGTEANDEIINGAGAPGMAGIPAAPGMDGGTNGTGVTDTETNTNIHIHRGTVGDDDPTGGKSDLDNRIHHWLNPVLRVKIVVQ